MPDSKLEQLRYGATVQEWLHFANQFPERLNPIVCNPNARISDGSSLKKLGKVPSRYNKSGEVVGIPNWPRRCLTEAEMRRAMREPDYGISITLGNGLAAFDVDLEDEDLANLFETIAYKRGFRGGCVRFRENSARRLILFRTTGEFRKSVLRSDTDIEGCVEILGDGQQFVAAGTHQSGARYQWRKIREW